MANKKTTTNETNYSVAISESSKELTAKEKVMFKDVSDAVKLDEATKEAPVIIHPDYYLVLDVHNSKSTGNEDYQQYLVVDVDGTKYVTGSASFWSSFLNIVAEMLDVTDEEWGVKVHREPSKNFKGKDFLTCSVI